MPQIPKICNASSAEKLASSKCSFHFSRIEVPAFCFPLRFAVRFNLLGPARPIILACSGLLTRRVEVNSCGENDDDRSKRRLLLHNYVKCSEPRNHAADAIITAIMRCCYRMRTLIDWLKQLMRMFSLRTSGSIRHG